MLFTPPIQRRPYAMISLRPFTRSHALDRLFVLMSSGKIKPFYPSEGCPAFSGSSLPSHPNTDLVGHDSDFQGYIGR